MIRNLRGAFYGAAVSGKGFEREMKISWVDWMIVLIPVAFVWGMGWYSRRYARGVSDYLSAGRLCGRYVISVGDIANGLSIIGLMSYIEIHYKTGFALEFWKQLTLPLSIFIGLTGFFTYRFRETKAMSLGQFLEMRYSRKFRIFASGLRSLSEIIANSIMPAVAARLAYAAETTSPIIAGVIRQRAAS